MRNQVASAAIRAELARAGKEQKDVAAWLSYAPSGITQRMTGQVDWRLGELKIIAEKLGVPVSVLIDDSSDVTEAAAS